MGVAVAGGSPEAGGLVGAAVGAAKGRRAQKKGEKQAEGQAKQAAQTQDAGNKDTFKKSLVAYVLVNAFLVGIWALSDSGEFWPIWVIGGWGIGLGFQAYDAYGHRAAVSEDEVQREMQRLRGG